MRKIEHAMIAAIHNRKDWKLGNTEVINVQESGKPLEQTVWLHGNLIATIVGGQTVMFHFNSWQHFSRTTFSRINAICRQYCNGHVYTKNHNPMLSGMGNDDIELSVGDTWTFNMWR